MISANKFKFVLLGPIAAGVVALLWIMMVGFKFPMLRARSSTMRMIGATDQLVQNHVREYGDTPQNFSEIRLYGLERNVETSAYDAWGQRLEYLRLGKINYLLRSFGADGVENRPNRSPDIGVYHWGQIAQHGLRYDEDGGSMHPRPSVVLFAGADDSSSKWHAKLFVDPLTGVRRLLVRSRERHNFFMLAPHDGVEEFLWVPGQSKIVFTASQSLRYSDGLYVWDLATDEASNLFALDPKNPELNPGFKQHRYFLAISSVRNTNPPSVSAFAVPAEQFLLDPRRFFHPSNLHVFTLDQTPTHTAPSDEAASKPSLYDLGFLGTETIAKGGEGSALQKAWLKLPLGGDWEKGVIAWQDFASQNGKSQLAPYAVWGVAMFYQEAAHQSGRKSRDGQIFTGYSVELGSALSKMIVAPGYVRGIGAWIQAQP